ncbi:MAG: hypothetical protein Q9Q40_10025 [Acidobacteriota bacterium]|nr:hypothetical protein [Acidobacteriota bacterium]MDQ7087855.1 hypothetical protein [Acidobacteriota bacterium]
MDTRWNPEHGQTGQDRPQDDLGYVAPEIQTYTPEEFLNLLGPAQGYGGGTPGGERGIGRGMRLFPGMR